MNVRKGMARVARVTAVAYWAVAIIALASNFPGEMTIAENARIPDEPIKRFTIKFDQGGISEVDARSETMLQQIVKAHIGEPKAARDAAMLADSYLRGALKPDKSELLVEAARRKLLDVDEKTRRAIIDRDGKEWRAVALAAAFATLKNLAWVAAAYVALWATFRAIRWVLLGFMDTPDAPKP